jgi:pimeloyl-ACP methyl ester carboxylesterase
MNISGSHARFALFCLALSLPAGCGRNPYGVNRISEDRWVRINQGSALTGRDLSPFTALTLRQRRLEEDHARNPDEVIARLSDELRTTPSRRTAAALAELCYQRAKALKKGSPPATRMYLSAALAAWSCMFDGDLQPPASPFDQRFHLACALYNHSLANAVINLRNSGARWGSDVTPDTLFGPVHFAFGANELSWGTEGTQFHEVLTTYEFEVRGIANHLRTSGLGVPLIGLRHPPPPEQGTEQDRFLPRSRDQGFPATLLMRPDGSLLKPPASGQARTVTLELYDPTRTQEVTIQGQRVPLETDTTTPLAYVLEHAELPKPLQGLLDPAAWNDRRGLYMLLPYQEGKIPLVFVHGLASSPLTWLPMINDLLGHEEIRRHYQIWYFLYPTGNPILYNAAMLRGSLLDARKAFDPDGSDPAFDDMVLVGHSMGGLLSRLNVSPGGDHLWGAVFTEPLRTANRDDQTRQSLEQLFYFEPLPFLRRVVFIAVPHRGSGFADMRLTEMLEGLVSMPADLAAINAKIGALGPKIPPRRISSVSGLSQHNPVLHAMDTTPIREGVKYNSIIADHEEADRKDGTDTIVPYSSSHLEGFESEVIVKGVHTCTGDPLVILEVERILLKHAAECELPQDGGGR